MTDFPIRILVVDDHTPTRQGLICLLAAQPDIQVVGEACDGYAAIELARKLQPAAILMDITMPEINGIDATRIILAEMPDTKVLIVSDEPETEVIDDVLSSGALGFVSKHGRLLELPAILRALLSGHDFVPLSSS